MRFITLVLFLFTCGVSSVSLASPDSISNNRLKDSSVSFDAETGQISISSRREPLLKLLEKISKASGIDFLFIEPVSTEVSLDLDATPIEVALTQLLRNQNYIVVKSEASFRINKVLILPPGQEDSYSKQSSATNTQAESDPVAYINGIVASVPVTVAKQPPEQSPEQSSELLTAISSAEFDRILEQLPDIDGLRETFEATREHWLSAANAGYYRISPDTLRDEKSLSTFLGVTQKDDQM